MVDHKCIEPSYLLHGLINRYVLYYPNLSIKNNEFIIYPGTGLDLIISYDGKYEKVVCPRKSITNFRAQTNQGFFLIRFNSGAFNFFSDIPYCAFQDLNISLEDIWGEDWLEVKKLYVEEIDWSKKKNILDFFFIKMKNKFYRQQALEFYKLLYLFYKNEITIKNFSNELNIGIRQFERIFKAKIGITAKEYQLTARFEKSIKDLLLFDNLDMHDITLRNGFYDQNHFIKNIKRFTSETPCSLKNNVMSHFYYYSKSSHAIFE